MASFIERLRIGITAFKEAFVTSSVEDSTDWSDQRARILRYAINWAAYEATNYRDVHNWAESYRARYGMYRYTRPIYNPMYRLGQFWQTHLFGGVLNSAAENDGAIPIETENEALRPVIAELWKWSRWSVKKDILTVRGTVMGDIGIRVVDDVTRGRVYLDLVHPGVFSEVDRDPFGNVKGYVITESRPDPRIGARGDVIYREEVIREGDYVVYRTFLNGEPYAWPDNVGGDGRPVPEWREPYGFVPLVLIQHNDVGLEWGWSECHPLSSKMREVDEIASQLSDQIRKQVDPVWLMKGIKRTSLTLSGADATTDKPYPGREEMQAIWNVPEGGGAEAMVAGMDMVSVLNHLQSLISEIERDLPELSQDMATASGDASGRALRVARQRVTAKVQQRRPNYDEGMVRANQMAVAIGGFRGYDGYEGFGLDSYAGGGLDHTIANRPVFEEDPLDKYEIETALWQSVKVATDAGADLEGILSHLGWDDDDIELVVPEKQDEDDEEDVPAAFGEDNQLTMTMGNNTEDEDE